MRYSDWTVGWMVKETGFDYWEGKIQLVSSRNVLTACGAHPAFYPVGTGEGAYSPGVNRLGREADYSSPQSAEVNNVWSCSSTAPHASWLSTRTNAPRG
jgi:hypothetical protein